MDLMDSMCFQVPNASYNQSICCRHGIIIFCNRNNKTNRSKYNYCTNHNFNYRSYHIYNFLQLATSLILKIHIFCKHVVCHRVLQVQNVLFALIFLFILLVLINLALIFLFILLVLINLALIFLFILLVLINLVDFFVKRVHVQLKRLFVQIILINFIDLFFHLLQVNLDDLDFKLVLINLINLFVQFNFNYRFVLIDL